MVYRWRDLTSPPPPPPPIPSLVTGTLGVMPAAAVVEGLGLPVMGGTQQVNPTAPPPVVSAEVNIEDGTVSAGGATSGGSCSSAPVTSLPFILSEGLAPVPAKLVSRILKDEFVDMADLLRDNLEARRRGDLPEATSSSTEPKRSRREVPDLLSWVQCFGTYVAIVTSHQPVRIKQLLAYQTFIVREARRCGGRGWLAYDSLFRQQAAGNPAVDWSKLNPTLYAVTFLAQSGSGKNCILCMEADHREDECALSKGKVSPSVVKQSASRDPPRGPGEVSHRFPRAKGRGACFSWNQGECSYPGYCRYRHFCSKCGGDHRQINCRFADREGSRDPGRRQGRDRDVRSGAEGAGRSG